ncbi:acetyl-CoA carboxylase biotin carboxyl carrier protein [Oricola cellulosilytica]|uniref:Biotin carboxyl carrier protein of acetyl-CoA carboxylase n=1 Tax=Oricola cellulosilytica TaxID=1429082 RepID=A0A4R0PBS7_9HYPH|nr:acetyl-CoA carboxylase biotin carboxyl carrier protein [Oricola cellulosilytica]TCD14506.1 acetyl-CoA carboxylase biotin carboxyl carrier protein [Oricola cellulosilytica]
MAERKPAIDTGLVKDLADILTETNLTEIEIEQGELRIRVSRDNPAPSYVQASAPVHQQAPPAAAPNAQPASAHQPQKTEGEKRDGEEVPSPMVGTAYLAAAPGAAPFIEVGQSVKEGQTLLIIEAMKTMNQIPAPRAGTVKEILIADSEPVEFGQPLVVLG